MEFGEIRQYEQLDDETTKESVVKFRNGVQFGNLCEYRQRVRVTNPADLNLIIEKLHVEHALKPVYGAWLEKSDSGKMYVIKYWVDK